MPMDARHHTSVIACAQNSKARAFASTDIFQTRLERRAPLLPTVARSAVRLLAHAISVKAAISRTMFLW